MAKEIRAFITFVGTRDDDKIESVGVVSKSDLLAEHYGVVQRAREGEIGIT